MINYITFYIKALGLNEHHQATVLNYMRFARYQRGQRLRCVDGCFSDLKDSRYGLYGITLINHKTSSDFYCFF